MNRFTLMCDNPYTTCIRAEQELNKLMGEVDKLRQVKDRLLEENTRLQAERDKAVEDLKGHCHSCTFSKDCSKHDNNDAGNVTWHYGDCDDWQWRGLEESE